MLDVDGHVISAAELVNRVEQLLQSIDANEPYSGGAVRDKQTLPARATGLDQHIYAMRELHARLHPPDVGSPAGLRRRGVRFAKRAVRKLTAWYVEPRWILQQDYDAHIVDFADGLYQQLDELRRREARLRLQVVSSLERVNRLRTEHEHFIASVDEHLRCAASQEDLHVLREEVTAVLTRLGAASAAGADIDYVAFEERFRGAEVSEAQKRYLTLFPPVGFPGRILDIGCGRGEMLELLREAGHKVVGVDLDADMVKVCFEKGLPVVQDDGNHFLERTDNDSLKGIFCAQVVEHLLTSELEQLVRLARNKLQPSGVMIIETINPRSLYAINNHFLADISHIRPVHPETLRFICEQLGFRSVQLEERSPHPMLQLSEDLPQDKVGAAVGALLRSVFGYQDYAIVATK